MKIARRSLLAAAITLASALAAPVVAQAKTELVIGATAGPYADQVKIGIKPLLEKKGYKVRVVEFNDYVQPNFALAQGALDANAFQHVIYLRKFARDNRLELSEVIKVPTAPIAVYSKKHESLDAVSQGATVALPNDPTNAARALVMLQDFGWIRLKADFDPVTASERDVAENIKGIRLIPLEAAQLPRSLDDTDFSFVNGNFAIASGLPLTSALALEQTSPDYQNLVAVRTADRDKPWVKDIAEAYRSREFLEVTEKHFAGFVQPEYQRSQEVAQSK